MEPKELNEKEENQATKEKPKENAINNKVKSIEIKEDFNIKIEINKWEQKTNKETKKLEVMFNIELYSELTKKKWNVYHSIQDFNNLIATLSQYFPNFPEIPKLKPPEKENSSSIIITKASTAIIDFINLISHRSDIINSKLYIDFFNLENHFIDYTKYEPIEKIHIKSKLGSYTSGGCGIGASLLAGLTASGVFSYMDIYVKRLGGFSLMTYALFVFFFGLKILQNEDDNVEMYNIFLAAINELESEL